jgi:antibiotic biosynthesis monooxygenase (ABM) superfamily enzyme
MSDADPSPRSAVIERHITFDVLPDRTGDFERFFADEYRPAMTASPGYVSAALLREADSQTRYQMVLRFADADASAAWRTSEVHKALQPALEALHNGMHIQGYETIA